MFVIFKLKARVQKDIWSFKKAISLLLVFCIISGVICGTILFWGVVKLFIFIGFKMALGHDEIIIASMFFNVAFSLAMFATGIVVLKWKNIVY